MTILPGQILSQFFWPGTGTGTITAGAAVPGSLLPGADLNGQTVGYNVTNPDTPTEVEVGQGVWSSGASTLTRAVIWVNALTGARNPSATAINFTATNAKIVTLVSLPIDFGALAALATVGTAQVTDDAITNAKLANMVTGTVKARSTASTGDPEDRAVGTGLTLDGTSLRVNPAAVDHDALQNFVANEHVDHSGVTVAGQQSIAGSGAITASVTLNLVNDATTPGTNKVYGTDGSGVRGWKNDPTGAGATLPTDDTTSIARDPVDGTRQMRIDAGAVATSTVRVLFMGNRDANLAAGGTYNDLYTVVDTAPAPSSGISTYTPSATSDFILVSNVLTTDLKINTPTERRNLFVMNTTGAPIAVVDAASADIITGAGLPHKALAVLTWTGSAWIHKASFAGGDITAEDVDGGFSPANYSPVTGTSIRDHLAGIDAALVTLSDAPPVQVLSNAAEYVLLTANRMHLNVENRSHQANVDFEVPNNATAGSKWLVYFDHTGCTGSVDTDAGSVNGVSGGSVRGILNGFAIFEVKSNAGTAPVVLVRGDVIVAPTDVTGTKTYTDDDSNQDYRLTTTATQTFNAASTYRAGFYVNLLATTGTTLIDGTAADYSAVARDGITVMKVGTELWAIGKHASSPVLLSTT